MSGGEYVRFGIDQLSLGTRARRLLIDADLLGVYEVRRQFPADLMAIRGMGATTVQEIQDALRIFDIGYIAWQVEQARVGRFFGRPSYAPETEQTDVNRTKIDGAR